MSSVSHFIARHEHAIRKASKIRKKSPCRPLRAVILKQCVVVYDHGSVHYTVPVNFNDDYEYDQWCERQFDLRHNLDLSD
jgi:FAD/FMN-containing dehydrogenase